MMTVAVAMGADFSSVLVWDLFADLVWYQLAFFYWDGVWDLDWYLVAHFFWLFVAFSLYDLTNGWFTDSLWNNSAMWFLDLSCNLNWYLSTDMLNVNRTMRSWSGISLSLAWSLSFTLVNTFTSECETTGSFLGVISIISNWVWNWSWSNWGWSNG